MNNEQLIVDAAQLTDVEKINKLPWLITGDVLNTVFVSLTFAGSVFILFLDELGLDNAQIGLLLSLIPFCGIVAPFVAPVVTRFGYKRIFVTFWGLRKIVFAFMLLTPVVLAQYGTQSAFYWVTAVIFGFALCRAIAETGGYPWRKEIVPDAMRGKFSATATILSTIAAIVVTTIAGYVIDNSIGLGRFMVLMAVGVVMGLLSVAAYARVPAEGPHQAEDAGGSHIKGMKLALYDRNFTRFLWGLGLATIGTVLATSFIPLYMKQQIGLSDGIIVLLSIGTFMGALLTSYLWGWTADRYGSRPVMQFSLYMMLILPFAWFLLPRNSPASAPLAMAIAVLLGVTSLAWDISWTRYLFVNATPSTNRSAYMAIFYAWISLTSGLGPLLAGWILTFSQNLYAQFFIFTIDPYTPLFVLSVVLMVAAAVSIETLKSEQNTTFKRFAGMFLRGNPIRTLGLLVQYNFAGTEMTRIAATERMGDTGSPLSTQELIELLHDPSFNVRYEAIHSIGRLPPEPELVDALIDVLQEGESELGMAASRALGKLGDARAIDPLRRALFSEYQLVQANSARALAMLEDAASIPVFLERLKTTTNPTIRMGYVSAVGRLRVAEAVDDLFAFLHQTEPEIWRAEIGLALARIVGDERYYLQHARAIRANFNTEVAQCVLALQKPAKAQRLEAWITASDGCSRAFAQGHISEGAQQLRQLIEQLPTNHLSPTLSHVLNGCAKALTEFDGNRHEVILLALHTLNAAFQQE